MFFRRNLSGILGGREVEGGEVGLRRRDVDGGLALSNPHKLAGEFFSPPTLQQQTKRKMEKSLCVLAAVIFLGGFSEAAQIYDAATETYSLLNNTTTESVTVEPQGHSTDRPTPTTAQAKLSTATVRDQQLDTENISRDSKEEKNDKEEEETDERKTEEEKTELGRTKNI